MNVEKPDTQEIVDTLEEMNPNALLYDGFDEALVGIIARCGTEPLALYDRKKCIQILMDKGASHEEAEYYFCYNVEGCWAGPNTPFIVSFDLTPLGMRFPIEADSPIISDENATDIFIGTQVRGQTFGEE